jgi:hypothetical protein
MKRYRLITLVAGGLLSGFLCGNGHSEEPTKGVPPIQAEKPVPGLTKQKGADQPSIAAPAIGQEPKMAQSACCSPAPNSSEGWTSKDVAALLSGIAGFLGAGVAALAIWSNGRTTRATTIQKANEAELAALDAKLDKFYGPYLQLSSTNRLIATELKSRQPEPEKMRILLILLDPDWRSKLSKGDAALVDEIVAIDEALLKLIQEASGLTSSAVQPYLWRAASHFRMMMLAHQAKLDNDPERYASYVYPRQLDEVLELETDRIHGRMETIRRAPMQLHPLPRELIVPERLKLAPWPGKAAVLPASQPGAGLAS